MRKVVQMEKKFSPRTRAFIIIGFAALVWAGMFAFVFWMNGAFR